MKILWLHLGLYHTYKVIVLIINKVDGGCASSDATPTITFGRAAITDLAGNGLAETSITVSDGIAPSLQRCQIVSPI